MKDGGRRNGWRGRAMLGGGLVLLVAGSLTQLGSYAQAPKAAKTRFKFQVVQSINAKYLGDSPAHLGRGSLEGTRPDISLGDPVFDGEVKVGTVTSVTWDRSRDSLEVEFDPEPYEANAQGQPVRALRISVGLEFSIPFGGAHTSLAKGR